LTQKLRVFQFSALLPLEHLFRVDWQNFTLQQSCSKIIHTYYSIQYTRAKQGCANALSQTAAIATCVHLHLCTCLSLPPGCVIVVMYV